MKLNSSQIIQIGLLVLGLAIVVWMVTKCSIDCAGRKGDNEGYSMYSSHKNRRFLDNAYQSSQFPSYSMASNNSPISVKCLNDCKGHCEEKCVASFPGCVDACYSGCPLKCHDDRPVSPPGRDNGN